MGLSANSRMNSRRRAILLLQDLARTVSNAAVMLPALIESVKNGDGEELKEKYIKIRKLDEETENIKRNLIATLISAGPMLSGRDELMRLVSSIASLMNLLEASAYRVTYHESIRNLSDDILNELFLLSKNVSEIVSRLRECIFLMGYTPTKVSEVGRKIVEKETQIDQMHRMLEIKLLNEKTNLSSTISLLEVIRRLESAADTALNALDLITILVML